jgi:dihydroorotate dehydrogenase electron transfer subunit
VPAAQFSVRVVENRELSGGYFLLDVEAEEGASMEGTRPGQFVMLRGEWGRDLINGRAFSVMRVASPRRFGVLAKVFGRGTALMQQMRSGDAMTCTGPLGTHFPAPRSGHVQLLVAGGVGLPPLHFQAREAAGAGMAGAVEMFYGGRSSDDIVMVDELERLAVAVTIATENGSRGVEGRVTVPLRARLDQARDAGESVSLLACGPTPMLHAVRELGLERGIDTHLCLEEQMACGFGVCLGCAVPVYGPKPYKYCCSDGPVFDGREVRWS